MSDEPNAVSLGDRPRPASKPPTRRERERRAAVTFWFAVERMLRRKSESPGPSAAETYPPQGPDLDDGTSGSGVPLRPRGSSGSAAAEAEPPPDGAEGI